MEKIVNTGLKIDLHIHSSFSKKKDGDKVAYNTEKNVATLIAALKGNEVNMCSITDHDTFNYSLYKKIKEYEGNGSIKKVLPGIEFSVAFEKEIVIHIVTIFSDTDEAKIKNLEEIMTEGLGKTFYKNGCYSKKDYFELLDVIGIDFVMIAHQKQSVTSKSKAHPNDVMTLGADSFNKLVFLDYFDAYEFRNKKNELYNKSFIVNNNVEENLRFITGSDCHDWRYYPESCERESEFQFTYIKALPSFKGLAMAITDHYRISYENKFFSPVEEYVKEIGLKTRGQEIRIPLSKGINVIIGDNSVGKSLMLHAITGNYKLEGKNGMIKGYNKYLDSLGVSVDTIIPSEKIFMFNSQGEIREIFDNGGLKPNTYLQQFYPQPINAEKYRNYVENELERLYQLLKIRFEFNAKKKNLKAFCIPCDEVTAKCLTFVGECKKINSREIQEVVDKFLSVREALFFLQNSSEVTENDKQHIISWIEAFDLMKEKYVTRMEGIKDKNKRINKVNTFINSFSSLYSRKITDEQALASDFLGCKHQVIDEITELIKLKRKVNKYVPKIKKIKVVPEENPVGSYTFVSRLAVENIDSEYVEKLIVSVLRKNKVIDTETITADELVSIIKNVGDEQQDPIDLLKDKIKTKLDSDFKVITTIIEDSMDVYSQVSAGLDAQMYFSLICGEMRNKGIYIIDQPEDHISQKAIKKNVLKQFRHMGENRQVIMVTHNPQFIINLDVDNVIYLSTTDNQLSIQSGALEYEDDEYSVLRLVADNIEGGLETIQGRMKRYEKDIGIVS